MWQGGQRRRWTRGRGSPTSCWKHRRRVWCGRGRRRPLQKRKDAMAAGPSDMLHIPLWRMVIVTSVYRGERGECPRKRSSRRMKKWCRRICSNLGHPVVNDDTDIEAAANLTLIIVTAVGYCTDTSTVTLAVVVGVDVVITVYADELLHGSRARPLWFLPMCDGQPGHVPLVQDLLEPPPALFSILVGDLILVWLAPRRGSSAVLDQDLSGIRWPHFVLLAVWSHMLLRIVAVAVDVAVCLGCMFGSVWLVFMCRSGVRSGCGGVAFVVSTG